MAPSSTFESTASPGRNSSGGSSFLGRFGRRPRTANSAVPSSVSTDSFGTQQPPQTPERIGSNSSSSSLHGNPANSASHLSFPTIDSTEQVQNSPSRVRSSARPSNFRAHTNNSIPEQPQSNEAGTSPSAGGSSNNPIGRMFRRYSQGAGKNNAAGAEAAALAASAAASRGQSSGIGSALSAGTSPQRSARVSSELLHTSSVTAATTADTSRHRLSATARPPGDGTGEEVISASSHGVGEPEVSNTEAEPATQDQTGTSGPSRDRESRAETSAPAAATSTSVHRIRLVPHLEAARSLHFEPVERDLTESARPVKIGRFTDRTNVPPTTSAGVPSTGAVQSSGEGDVVPESADQVASAAAASAAQGSTSLPSVIGSSAGGGGGVESLRVAFKSKVVSRGHAELWCEPGGKFFIRDTRSSSGTFLNHIRLSAPGLESRPFPLKDGDIIQLGVDYQGGTEEIYRCVKMRVELNRGWQRVANQFNVNAMRQLRALQGTPAPPISTADASSAVPTNRQSMSVTDCCICLFSVTVCQALFIAPCSHVFHYKCIRPLLAMHHPGFSCPLCRTFADLEADVEQDDVWQEALAKEEAAQRAATAAALTPAVGDVLMEDVGASGEAAATAEGLPVREGEDVDMESSDQQGVTDRPNARTARVGASEATARGSVFPHATTGDVLEGFEPTSASMDETGDEREVMEVDANEGVANGAASASAGSQASASSNSSSATGLSSPVTIARSGNGRSHDLRLDGLPSTRWSPHSSNALFDEGEARTPQNQHFLATLAEAPPPPRSSLRGVSSAHRMIFDEMSPTSSEAAISQIRDRSLTPVEAALVASSSSAPRRVSDSSGVEQVFGTAQASPAMSREVSQDAAVISQSKGKETAAGTTNAVNDGDAAASGSRKRERGQETSWNGDSSTSPERDVDQATTGQDYSGDSGSGTQSRDQTKSNSPKIGRFVDGVTTTAP